MMPYCTLSPFSKELIKFYFTRQEPVCGAASIWVLLSEETCDLLASAASSPIPHSCSSGSQARLCVYATRPQHLRKRTEQPLPTRRQGSRQASAWSPGDTIAFQPLQEGALLRHGLWQLWQTCFINKIILWQSLQFSIQTKKTNETPNCWTLPTIISAPLKAHRAGSALSLAIQRWKVQHLLPEIPVSGKEVWFKLCKLFQDRECWFALMDWRTWIRGSYYSSWIISEHLQNHSRTESLVNDGSF